MPSLAQPPASRRGRAFLGARQATGAAIKDWRPNDAMTETTSIRPTRRAFLRLLALGGGSLALAACAPAAAPSPPAAPKAAPTEAPKPAAPAATPAPAAAATTAPVATQAPAKQGKVILNIWAHWAGKQDEVWRALIDDFNKSQSDTEIKLSNIPLADMWTKVLAAIAAGSPPDSYTSAAMIRPELVKEKTIDPMDKYGKRPADMYKVFDVQTVIDGAWYGVPTNGGLCALFYNEDLYKKMGLDPDKPPTTWDELTTQAKKLTDLGQNQFGIAVPAKPYSWTVEVWYGFLLEAGGEFLTPDNSQSAFNSDAGVQALQFWVDLIQTHKVAPLASLDNNGLLSNYQTGKVGIFPYYPVATTTVATYSMKSRTAPLPKKARQGTHFAGGYMPMMAGGKNKEALWKFFDWWMRPENNARWCAETGGLPIRQGATDHRLYQDYLKKQPMVKAFLDSMDFAKPLPMVIGISEMEQVVSEAIESAVYVKAKPKDALDHAATKVNDVIKKYK